MRLQTHKHEDVRRVLTEWISDEAIRTCKVIEVKEDSELGNHYHNEKTDFFYLLKGSGKWRIGNLEGPFNEGDCVKASAGEVHILTLRAGSILLEASSTPYDKEDEISVTH